jgi:hypothetical protein
MMMLLKSLIVEILKMFEDRRMSGACGMWHVVVVNVQS